MVGEGQALELLVGQDELAHGLLVAPAPAFLISVMSTRMPSRWMIDPSGALMPRLKSLRPELPAVDPPELEF